MLSPIERADGASGNRHPIALSVEGLNAWYGESHILHGMTFSLREGEVLAMLGRNGSGRTTTLRAVMGLVDRRSGSINVGGAETIRLASHVIARLGVGYCPEERGIFSKLTCEENLRLPPVVKGDGMSLAAIYELMPNLAERRSTPGTRLSGGEQQMLAIARILRTGSRLLLLDEISEGLAPVIVDRLALLITELKRMGYSIVLVEQNTHFVEELADRYVIVERGKVALELTSHELAANAELLDTYIGV